MPRRSLLLILGLEFLVGILFFASWFYCDHKLTYSVPGPVGAVATEPTNFVGHSDAFDLAAAYREAHTRRDLQALLSLFDWRGVDDTTRAMVRASVSADLALEVVEIRRIPLDANQDLSYELQGVRYVPNLPPVGRLEIVLRDPHSKRDQTTRYLLGEEQGRLWIVSAQPVTASTTATTGTTKTPAEWQPESQPPTQMER